MKLPAKRNELANNKQAMAERLAAMRKDAGIGDRRTLHFTCSATGKPFAISFKRVSEKHRFQIDAIESGRKGSWIGRIFGSSEEPAQHFAVSEFDFSGFACPHCGHKGSSQVADFFGCPCKRFLCGARITEANGFTLFACHDGCGKTGILGRAIESFAGDEGTGSSGPNAKRLSGPHKQITRK